MINIAKKYGILFILLAIITLSWLLQSQLLMNWDVSWDLLVTKRLLAGGSYTQDYFDLNPPLVLYLYIPVIMLTHFSLTLDIALRIYIFFVGLSSFIICFLLLRKILEKNETLLSYIFLTLLSILFFLLPLYELGEREHLLVMFTMPYFLLMTLRLQGRTLPLSASVGIGLFSALGFLIKPFFLFTPALVELYFIFKTKKWLAWLRPEILAMLIFLFIYIIFTWLIHPDYISTILPLALKYYYPSMQSTWLEMFLESRILFCYLVILFYFYIGTKQRNNTYPLNFILLLGMLGFLLSYFVQRTDWSYHIFPALGFSLLIISILFYHFLLQNKNLILSLLYFTLAFSFPVYCFMDNYTYGVNYKNEHAKIIHFIQQNGAQTSVYTISADTHLFPSVEYARANYASRFLHFFWMPSLVKNTFSSLAQKKDEQYFIRLITEDINQKKPDLIFIDMRKYKSFFAFKTFDYLPYFLKDEQFKNAWKPYHYLTLLEQFPIARKDSPSWQLYWAPLKETIDPRTLTHPTIIITGKSNPFTAHYVVNKKFLKSENNLLNTAVFLTANELLLLKTPGIIQKNKLNTLLITEIINRAVQFPVYQLAVYKRDPE